MKMKYLLDTNVFREVGKSGGHADVIAWASTIDDSAFYLSSLTVLETWKGIERLRKSKPEKAAAIEGRVQALFDDFKERIVDVTPDVAREWGQLLAQSEKHFSDTGLAATAKVNAMVLVTRNIKHVMGRDVSVLDPFVKCAQISVV